ncbi:TPA: PTS sugar transporter subunit IIC [Streptococcus suis]|uniref:PTS sugar transporter subunit IIC n=1 Tax=Streptococcus iners TaxID=3028084 RepID=A0AA97AF57_9STRE|nr:MULTISPECIES: PTS sugar transporter subunit IIC [Streptococcus]MCK4025688.1 PTS sugar transporter subunit IIC [Streptococcus suis]MDN3007048.1 PTS sugar transporter subunit IIC [Streptococcus suis]MDN3009370.1 PTS sugar transporter subunit IIC [Streptococcus suis]NQF76035.1 PTS sugar transporter subunit IIC [Streptococcus suis]NQK22134.1 PTS sugar transporter subunit IIC [Streptococcus suis]
MIQALLIAAWAGLCAIDDIGTQMLRRPLLIAPVIGLIMGDVQTSLLIGASLEVMWMGIGNVGAYSAPDIISGTAIGTALGLASGGVATAVAVAVPASLLAQQLLVLYRSSIVYLNPIAEKVAETGDFSKVYRINYIPMVIAFLIRAVPTFIAVYLGAGVVDQVVAALPKEIMSGLSVAGKIIPAVGIGLLMLMMLKKAELWTFLIAGFALAVYLQLSVLPITLIALPIALIYDLATQKAQVKEVVGQIDNDEEDYDL